MREEGGEAFLSCQPGRAGSQGWVLLLQTHFPKASERRRYASRINSQWLFELL